jgi:hypothetical protein
MKKLAQYLELNGKLVWFLQKDGVYYIAIKPICEALNIEYTRTFKNIKSDSILGPALAKQPMQVPNDQIRNFACLPEKWIYGWIFSINSDSPILEDYKRKCYDILYNHFHGSLTAIQTTLLEKDCTHAKIEELEKRLISNDDYKNLVSLRAKEMRFGIVIKEQLKDLTHGQLRIGL